MTKNMRIILLTGILITLLCGCASQPVAVASCPKPAPLTKEMKVQAPPPSAFSKCLTEIIAVGQGQQAQISVACSTLLVRPQMQ